MIERDDYYGIYSKTLLGLTEPCTERNCDGRMSTTGFLRFNRHFSPERSWSLEFDCPKCHLVTQIGRKDDLPLVRNPSSVGRVP
jgi:hypothetical protein